MKECPLVICSPEGMLFNGMVVNHIPLVNTLKESVCRLYFANDSMRLEYFQSGQLTVSKEKKGAPYACADKTVI